MWYRRFDASCLNNLSESGYQSLRQPEAEDEFWSGHQELGGQSLEEAAESFVLDHAADDTEAGFWVLKVAVLDSGLDDIERSGDN